MFEFDEARILRIFNAYGLKMPLNQAFDVAGNILEAHLNRVNEVENNTWKVAQDEAARRVKEVKEEYRRDTVEKLREFQSQADTRFETIVDATLWARKFFLRADLNERKIWCIKRVRESYPVLSLREAKYIIDSLL